MTEEVKPEVIKKTQDVLKKHIKKPPLTDKLLKKPPFRFLHDIVTNIISETGFLNGLFSPEELNHENIKDRDGKVAFLDKLISAVKIITGIPLSVRATKIVAGHEPTKTNELLQAIGTALEKKLDSKDVAQQLQKKGSKKSESGDTTKKTNPKRDSTKSKASKLQGESKPARDESTDKKENKLPSSGPSKDGDKNHVSQPAKSKSKKDRSHQETRGGRAKESSHGDILSKQPDHAATSVTNEDSALTRPLSAVGRRRSSLAKQSSGEKNHDLDQSSSTKIDPLKSQNPAKLEDAAQAEESLLESKDTSLPLHEPASQQEVSENKVQLSSTNASAVSPLAPIPLARPRTAARVGSARPGAPRVRNRSEATVVTEELVRPSAVNLIVDGDSSKVDQDEDENLVVVETTTVDNSSAAPDVRQAQGSRPSSQQGHLVAQILETQKELDIGNGAVESEQISTHHTEIEWEAGRKRERESAAKEMERMRALVQTLTRAAHPLGKLLDSLEEDVDNMHRELLQWQKMQASLEEQLKIEESLSVQATQPLKEQLKQLTQAVRNQLDQLSSSKASILNNDQRIRQLLTGGQG